MCSQSTRAVAEEDILKLFSRNYSHYPQIEIIEDHLYMYSKTNRHNKPAMKNMDVRYFR